MPVRDRKNYFDKFSKTQGFDPLVPENWYSASFNSLFKSQVLFFFLFNYVLYIFNFQFLYNVSQEYKEILKYYRDLPGCLMHLYPNIGLQKMKFSTSMLCFVFPSSISFVLISILLVSLNKRLICIYSANARQKIDF